MDDAAYQFRGREPRVLLLQGVDDATFARQARDRLAAIFDGGLRVVVTHEGDGYTLWAINHPTTTPHCPAALLQQQVLGALCHWALAHTPSLAARSVST